MKEAYLLCICLLSICVLSGVVIATFNAAASRWTASRQRHIVETEITKLTKQMQELKARWPDPPSVDGHTALSKRRILLAKRYLDM